MTRPRRCNGRCRRCRRSRCVATDAELQRLTARASASQQPSRGSRRRSGESARGPNVETVASILAGMLAASMSRRDRRRQRLNPWRRGRRVSPPSATVGEIEPGGNAEARERRRKASRGNKVATPPRPTSSRLEGSSQTVAVGDGRAGSMVGPRR